MRLMHGAPIQAWRAIIDYDNLTAKHLHIYDYDSKECKPIGNDIPWPVAWFLCSHNPKHIFINENVPSLDDLREETIQLTHKIKWADIKGSSTPQQPIVKLKKPFSTPPCLKTASPDIERWAISFRASLMRRASSAVKFTDAKRWSNMFPLQRLAIRLLRKLKYIALPNDKGPGFSFVTPEDFARIELAVSNRPSYRPTRLCDIPVRQNLSAARAAARRVEAHIGHPGAAQQLNRSTYRDSFIASLGLNVKSHKDPGSVDVRNLHCCSEFPLEGLAKWLTGVLSQKLPTDLLLRDSLQAKDLLHNKVVPAGTKLSTLDIKDFYMSGSTDVLLSDCVSAFEGECALQTLVAEVLFLLLDSQYIVLRSDKSMHFKVVEGSGMGLLFSGAVASLSFFRRVEVHMITPGNLSEHRISCYQRYHDDIICAYQDSGMFVSFCSSLRQHASHFRVICSKVSSISVPYLDLTVSISNCHLHVEPTLSKPIIPLAPESGHAPWVHTSWPYAVMSRYCKLASRSSFSSAINSYYESNNVSPFTLQVLNRTLRSSRPSQPNDEAASSRTMWLKAVSHPAWNQAMQSWIKHMQPPACSGFKIRVAWRNGKKSMAQLIRAHNVHLMGGRMGPVEG